MDNKLIHISNVSHWIGYITTIQEALREKPMQLSSVALSNIADGFDRCIRNLDELKQDLIADAVPKETIQK